MQYSTTMSALLLCERAKPAFIKSSFVLGKRQFKRDGEGQRRLLAGAVVRLVLDLVEQPPVDVGALVASTSVMPFSSILRKTVLPKLSST